MHVNLFPCFLLPTCSTCFSLHHFSPPSISSFPPPSLSSFSPPSLSFFPFSVPFFLPSTVLFFLPFSNLFFLPSFLTFSPLAYFPPPSFSSIPPPSLLSFPLPSLLNFPSFLPNQLPNNFFYRAFISTQLEPLDARSMFPCFDEPALKATYNISFAYPKDMVGLSNNEVDKEETKGQTKTTYYKITPKMSTYLVSVVVGHFDHKLITTPSGVMVRLMYIPVFKRLFQKDLRRKTIPIYVVRLAEWFTFRFSPLWSSFASGSVLFSPMSRGFFSGLFRFPLSAKISM